MFTPEAYVKTNCAAVAENCINSHLWKGEAIAHHLEFVKAYEAENGLCDPDSMVHAVVEKLKNAAVNVEAFTAFIDERREGLASPHCADAEAYARIFISEEKTIPEILEALQEAVKGI